LPIAKKLTRSRAGFLYLLSDRLWPFCDYRQHYIHSNPAAAPGAEADSREEWLFGRADMSHNIFFATLSLSNGSV